MRQRLRRTVSLGLVLLLAACAMACANDKYDYRSASIAASADTSEMTLYAGDSTVRYTVTVPKQCVKITIRQLAGGADAAGEPLILNERAFGTDSEGVSVTVEGDRAVWTIPCDFGPSGMDGVRIEAQIPMGKKADYLYADVDIKIHYPAYTADTLYQACEAAVARNVDEPYYFTIDRADEALAMTSSFARSGDGTLIADYGFLYPAETPVALNSGELPGMFVPEGRLLCWFDMPNDDFSACYGQTGVRVADSARAILCSRAAVQPDGTLYPVAALLYDKAGAFLSGMPLDSLSAADQVATIYDRTYNEGRMALPPGTFETMDEAERAYFDLTAYGLLSGFGGRSQGYADAFYLLCGMAGIPCVKLPCEAVGGEKDYCVNAVQIEGAWYVVDIYAAAADSASDMYARFCLSGKQAEEFYVIDSPDVKLSSSTAYNRMAAPAGETP